MVADFNSKEFGSHIKNNEKYLEICWIKLEKSGEPCPENLSISPEELNPAMFEQYVTINPHISTVPNI